MILSKNWANYSKHFDKSEDSSRHSNKSKLPITFRQSCQMIGDWCDTKSFVITLNKLSSWGPPGSGRIDIRCTRQTIKYLMHNASYLRSGFRQLHRWVNTRVHYTELELLKYLIPAPILETLNYVQQKAEFQCQRLVGKWTSRIRYKAAAEQTACWMCYYFCDTESWWCASECTGSLVSFLKCSLWKRYCRVAAAIPLYHSRKQKFFPSNRYRIYSAKCHFSSSAAEAPCCTFTTENKDIIWTS